MEVTKRLKPSISVSQIGGSQGFCCPDLGADRRLPPCFSLLPVGLPFPIHTDRKTSRMRPAARLPPRAKEPETLSRAQTTPRAAASMPVLRQPHDHHRDLRARLRAEVPPHAAGSDQDRHVMMPSPLIYTYRSARHPCPALSRHRPSSHHCLNSIAVARPILSFYPQIARSHRCMRPCSAASRSRRPPQSNISKPEPAAKSP